MIVASISSMEGQALLFTFHWHISALQESGVSNTKMFDPAQILDFQCPRQAAMLGTTGAMVSRRSSANKLNSLSAAAARKL
jgi:hypothetical protein